MDKPEVSVDIRRKLEQKSADLRLLLELSTEISSTRKRRTLFKRIVQLFAKVAQTEKSSLMLLDEKKNELYIAAGIEISREARRRLRLKMGEGVAGRVAQSGRPLMINDTVGDPRYKPLHIRRKAVHKTESLLALPLITKGKVIGVITVSNKVSRQPFIRNDEILLGTLASQAAIAVENARLYSEVVSDGLTGLYTHTYFQRQLEKEIKRVHRHPFPLSLLMIDIDYFKEFNDTYGHLAGDSLLRNLAKMIKKNLRAKDLVARYGGEEFAIILHGLDHLLVLKIAQRLKEKVEDFDFLVGEKKVKVTVSIGVATWRAEISKKELINQADQALYQAKREGRNKVCVYQSK